jgi:putative tryptophan/tyrosine transport system substrate-binding protein
MRRREFTALFTGAAATWPLAARAQNGRVRRIAVMQGGSENEPDTLDNLAALRDGLAKLSWMEGRNLRVELRFGGGDFNRMRVQAAELVKLNPEVILAHTAAATLAAQQQTRTIPIVLIGGSDNSGGVKNIARPEGNTTGFPHQYTSMSGKWVEYIKEAARHVTRIGVVYNPQNNTTPGVAFSGTIEAAARALDIDVGMVGFRDMVELNRAIESFAAEPNGGLIVTPNAATATRDSRQAVLLPATRHRLPVVHWDKRYPADGGLMSYGSDIADLHRRAATYIDRLLRGTKISELPVQFPTKFDLIINLKAAKAIGLTIPETFLVRADQVIE